MTDVDVDDLDIDDLDPETLSLCPHCAKHPRLKRFVAEHAIDGVRCGICLNVGPAPDPADAAGRKAMIYLIRALIRFFYSEEAYNTHWGAEDSVTKLLVTENPIIESEPAPGFPRSYEQSWVFFEDIFNNDVYPPYGEGVAVYAGFDGDGGRQFNRSLPTSDGLIWQFRKHLETQNYFDLEPKLDSLFAKLDSRIAVVEPEGQVYWRARLGVAARFWRHEGFSSQLVYKPYQDALLGAPPPPLASAGRLNRAGVSFLYLASDVPTACAEIRPHPSQQLSVGQYRSVRPLRLADLEADIADFATSDAQLDLYAFVFAADQAMSLPVLPGEASGYSITQLIADVLRHRGFDGVAFKSSVAKGGRNVCIFKPADFEYVAGSARVWGVQALHYELSESDSVLTEEIDDMPLP